MTKFTCTYCDKEYDTPVERAKCEIACSEKIKREEEIKKQKEFELQKNSIRKHIEGMIKDRDDEVKRRNNEIKTEIEKYNQNSKSPLVMNVPAKSLFDVINDLLW